LEGGFELAVWAWGHSGSMANEAVGERPAELLVEEDDQKGGLDSFFCQAIGAALSVAGQQPVGLQFAQVVASWLRPYRSAPNSA